jgi:hypothetical protein
MPTDEFSPELRVLLLDKFRLLVEQGAIVDARNNPPIQWRDIVDVTPDPLLSEVRIE